MLAPNVAWSSHYLQNEPPAACRHDSTQRMGRRPKSRSGTETQTKNTSLSGTCRTEEASPVIISELATVDHKNEEFTVLQLLVGERSRRSTQSPSR